MFDDDDDYALVSSRVPSKLQQKKFGSDLSAT